VNKEFDSDVDEGPGEEDRDSPPDGQLLDLSRLTYQKIVANNPSRAGRGAFVSASYRFGDAAVVAHEVEGSKDGSSFRYYFSQPNPDAQSHPVAIEVRFREVD
jgi:hypothetical protein